MNTFSINSALRPAPQPRDRLSEAVRLELATSQLDRIYVALRDGLHVHGGKQGKVRRLSLRDRDALLMEEIARVMNELGGRHGNNSS
jgi:hypothetical protein